MRLPYCHQPNRPYYVSVFHPVDLNELHGALCRSEPDDYPRAGLHDVNMRRAVLAWRQENTDRKAGRPDDGWQLNPTLGLWQSSMRIAWQALARAWMTMPDFTRLIGIDSPHVLPLYGPKAGKLQLTTTGRGLSACRLLAASFRSRSYVSRRIGSTPNSSDPS